MQGRKGATDTLLLDKAFPNLATQTKYQKNQTGGMRMARALHSHTVCVDKTLPLKPKTLIVSIS
jgi:hypothetical protein